MSNLLLTSIFGFIYGGTDEGNKFYLPYKEVFSIFLTSTTYIYATGV